jgi:hypothetical protein
VVCRVGLANGKRAAWWLTVASLDRSPSIWQGYTAGTRLHICLIKVIPHSSAANQPFPDLAHTPRLHPSGPLLRAMVREVVGRRTPLRSRCRPFFLAGVMRRPARVILAMIFWSLVRPLPISEPCGCQISGPCRGCVSLKEPFLHPETRLALFGYADFSLYRQCRRVAHHRISLSCKQHAHCHGLSLVTGRRVRHF